MQFNNILTTTFLIHLKVTVGSSLRTEGSTSISLTTSGRPSRCREKVNVKRGINGLIKPFVFFFFLGGGGILNHTLAVYNICFFFGGGGHPKSHTTSS